MGRLFVLVPVPARACVRACVCVCVCVWMGCSPFRTLGRLAVCTPWHMPPSRLSSFDFFPGFPNLGQEMDQVPPRAGTSQGVTAGRGRAIDPFSQLDLTQSLSPRTGDLERGIIDPPSGIDFERIDSLHQSLHAPGARFDDEKALSSFFGSLGFVPMVSRKAAASAATAPLARKDRRVEFFDQARAVVGCCVVVVVVVFVVVVVVMGCCDGLFVVGCCCGLLLWVVVAVVVVHVHVCMCVCVCVRVCVCVCVCARARDCAHR